MLMYKRTYNLEVIGYSYSDFVGCVDSFKSTLGYFFLFPVGCAMEKYKANFNNYFHYGR